MAAGLGAAADESLHRYGQVKSKFPAALRIQWAFCRVEEDTKPAEIRHGLCSAPPRRRWRLLHAAAWFDTGNAAEATGERPGRIDWVRAVPFALMHLACIAVIWVGISWTAVIVAAALYAVRMFAITAFYHRYFSHRTFQASRPVQFVFAVIGASSVQRGPWWAAHHRHHHRHADQPLDPHSP